MTITLSLEPETALYSLKMKFMEIHVLHEDIQRMFKQTNARPGIYTLDHSIKRDHCLSYPCIGLEVFITGFATESSLSISYEDKEHYDTIDFYDESYNIKAITKMIKLFHNAKNRHLSFAIKP